MKSVKVFSPGTIGNIGPGFDTLGLAIKGMGDILEAKIITGNEVIIDRIQNTTHNISTDSKKNTASIAAMEALKLLGENIGVSLSITKGLPPGGGLGSSAASAVAGAYAVNSLFGNTLTNEDLLTAAMVGEYSVSGGYFADNVAPAIYGGATLTRSLNPLRITPLGSISDLIIIIAIPDVQILTKESRKVIPPTVELSDCIHNMANTASIAVAFCNNDYNLLKDNLYDYIIEPKRSKLIPGFADVKEAALNAGADGMAISGSGPTIFSITNSDKKAIDNELAMKTALNENEVQCKTMITTPSTNGVKEI